MKLKIKSCSHFMYFKPVVLRINVTKPYRITIYLDVLK